MTCLLIVDVQNDFCPGGALEVPKGDEVVGSINQLVPCFDVIVQTQDWHPPKHQSFASNHPGKNPMETITVDYGEQVLWPDHCVQGTAGARFHPALHTKQTQLFIRKGFRENIDSYSAFYENDQETSTGLTGYLRERSVKNIVVTGLATDFCVKWTVLDGIKEGFNVEVVEDAVQGIDVGGSLDKAWIEMIETGARKISTEYYL